MIQFLTFAGKTVEEVRDAAEKAGYGVCRFAKPVEQGVFRVLQGILSAPNVLKPAEELVRRLDKAVIEILCDQLDPLLAIVRL